MWLEKDPLDGGGMQHTGRTLNDLTPFIQAIDEIDAAAYGVLASAIKGGVSELKAADPNDTWNVTARFWPRTGRFGAGDLAGQPSLPHDALPSDLMVPPHAEPPLASIGRGHGEVVVLVSMVSYLRATHDLSVHALTSTLLEEAQRLVDLRLPVVSATPASQG